MRWLTVAAALASLLLLPGVAAAGHRERLVWAQSFETDSLGGRIVIADPDGRNVRPLTHPPEGAADVDPKISPDGTRVLFERDFPDGNARVGLVGVDGRGERVLDLGCTDPCASDNIPNWTPDGRHVTWTRVVGPFDPVTEDAQSAVLWIADLHGRHVRRLSPPGVDPAYEETDAEFAPGGYLILLRLARIDGEIKSAILRRDLDGRHERQLTPWSVDADLPDPSPARWGPTRDLVVFETFGHGPPEGVAQAVATVPATCRGEDECASRIRYLTSPSTGPFQHFNPAWSPDGRRIAFVRFGYPPLLGDIWTMRWNGADQRAVADSPLFDYRPEWGRTRLSDSPRATPARRPRGG